MATLLYVDDEPALLRAVHAWLERSGHVVRSASTIAAAKERLAESAGDGVVIDLWLPDGSGFELVDWVAEHRPALAERVLFVTGDIAPSTEAARQLAMLGRPVLIKPFDLDELERHVRAWEEPWPARQPPEAGTVTGSAEAPV